MADPLKETIAAAIKTRIETVTTGNGYNQDVAAVVRPARLGNYKLQNYLVVIEQGASEDDEENAPHNYKQWVQQYFCDLFVETDDDATAAVDTTINQFEADVQKAFMADPKNFGIDAVIDRRVRESIPFDSDDGSVAGVTVVLEVTFRHIEEDPYDDGG